MLAWILGLCSQIAFCSAGLGEGLWSSGDVGSPALTTPTPLQAWGLPGSPLCSNLLAGYRLHSGCAARLNWGSSEPGQLVASASCPSTPPSLPAWGTQVGWKQHRPQQPCPGHASHGEVLGPGPEQVLRIMRMLRGAQQPTRSRPESHPPGQQTPATLRKKTLFGMKIERPPLPLPLIGCRPGRAVVPGGK